MNNTIKTDVLIAGCGCSGLYMAMNLPADKKILMITKSDCESSDSFLAQGTSWAERTRRSRYRRPCQRKR